MTTGYFWLPCPMCGESFAGFEAAPMLHVPTGDHSSAVACRVCENEWISAAAPICSRAGHDPTLIWHGRRVRREGTVVGPLAFRLGAPDEIRCARCHIQLAVAE